MIAVEQIDSFPHLDISLKVVLAIGVGLLVGLEREFASKDIGLRTFSLISLLGLFCALLGTPIAVTAFFGVICIIIFVNGRSFAVKKSIEITTSAALLVTFTLGMLVGENHVFTPVTGAILMTFLLAWKTEFSAFAHGLKLEEIRSAVLLGLLTFVIYPLLPDRFIDPWDLFNPKQAWMTVLILAGISFLNYVLLKAYSTRGLYYSSLLGGAVNSSVAVTELSRILKQSEGQISPEAISILLMTTIAMFIRNLVLLGALEPSAIPIATAPLLGMIGAALLFVLRSKLRRHPQESQAIAHHVASPVSFVRVLKFGIIFIFIQAFGTLAQRFFGSVGLLAISFFGGLVSSASTTAAAAKLASTGKTTDTIAGIATVLTSITSAFVNLPIVHQITNDKVLTRKLGLVTLGCIGCGLLLMLAVHGVQVWMTTL